jgi:hypothetical protein
VLKIQAFLISCINTLHNMHKFVTFKRYLALSSLLSFT